MWLFKTKDDDLIYIENTSKTKVLGATSDGKVILEDFEEGKVHQLWKKGELDCEDYFTLENSGVLKVLTAISESSLEIKGKTTMRLIELVDYLLIIYHVVFLQTDHEGYSTLENSKVPKIMTAISSNILKVIGNIPLR